MKSTIFVKSNQGFTLIEILMVILLVAILSAVAIPQFLDFRTEAKNASTNMGLSVIRTGITGQVGQMIIRCKALPGTYPTALQMMFNSITQGGAPCSNAMIPNPLDRQIVLGILPENPWSGASVAWAQRRLAQGCAGNGCLRDGTVSCDGVTPYGPTIGGWCYQASTGKVWANSNNNGVAAPNGEYSF